MALTGCVSNTLDALSNGCTTSLVSVNCASTPASGGTSAGTGAVTTTVTGGTTTTAPTVNTGNTTTLTAGDTTIALEGSLTITTLTTSALSKLVDSPLNHLTVNQTAGQQIWFDTKTASNVNWPVSKPMPYFLGGTGLGADYKLYRYYLKNVYNEELQIWTWNNSYATQYRDVTASGTDPQHQAFSFGGTYTTAAAMPTSGTVGYTGEWGATAKTSNFAESTDPAQTVKYNNSWRVNGTSALTADFGAGKFTGQLNPLIWQGVDKNNGLTDVDVVAAQSSNAACISKAPSCDPSTAPGLAVYTNWINYNRAFMKSNIILDGTITKSATNTAKPNQIVGTASEDRADGWITSANNPMYAGFFGPSGATAKEVTGVFAYDAALPGPNDGRQPINNDRIGFMQMSGELPEALAAFQDAAAFVAALAPPR